MAGDETLLLPISSIWTSGLEELADGPGGVAASIRAQVALNPYTTLGGPDEVHDVLADMSRGKAVRSWIAGVFQLELIPGERLSTLDEPTLMQLTGMQLTDSLVRPDALLLSVTGKLQREAPAKADEDVPATWTLTGETIIQKTRYAARSRFRQQGGGGRLSLSRKT